MKTLDIKKNKVIVTNNKEVKDFYINDKKGYLFQYDIVFLEKIEDVFLFVRDLIHMNWSLINNPMAGNIPLYKHPFRSVALEKSNFDARSLSLWDSATERFHRGRIPEYPLNIMEDYAHLDFILFTDNLPL